MKAKYLIVVGVAIAAVAILYFAGDTTKPHTTESHDHNHEHESDAGMMMGNQAAPADFDSLLTAAKKKLSPQAQAEISLQENNISRGDVKQQRIVGNEALGKLWLKYKNRRIAAHYFGISGKLENSEKKLNFAAHLFSEELEEEANPSIRRWMADEAIDYYKHSLSLNPTNDTVKYDLAIVYIDGAGEVMNGIQELLAIVRKDSAHVPANVLLGKMAVQSGQLDKAIERGNTVLEVDSDNVEAHLFMGEAYKRQGNKAKAIELFTGAKRIMNNPEFSKEVDAYVKTF